MNRNLPDLSALDAIDVGDDGMRSVLRELTKVLKPVQDEITETLETVRKSIPDKDEVAFLSRSIEYTMTMVKSAIADLAAPMSKALSTGEVTDALIDFNKKNGQEQVELLSKMLGNSEFQRKILESIQATILGDSDRAAELLTLAKTNNEIEEEALALANKRDSEKDRAERRYAADARAKENDVDDDSSNVFGLLLKPQGFLLELASVMSRVATTIGALGALKMLPDAVTDFIGDFTSTFTVIREMIKVSWLEPILKIIEHIPLLGTIVKKIPYLNALIAAWEILPKMVDEWKKKDWISALELGLKDLYQFMVGDVALILSNIVDWAQEKLFGGIITDFSDIIVKENANFVDNITKEFVRVREAIESGSIADLFGFEIQEGGVADHVAKMVSRVISFFQDVASDPRPVSQQVSDAVGRVKDDFFAWLGSWRDAFTGWVADRYAELSAWVDELAADFKKTMVSYKDSMSAMPGKIWSSLETAFWTAWDAAIAGMTGLKDDLIAWVYDVVDRLKNYVLDQLPFGLGDSLKSDESSVHDDPSGSKKNERALLEKSAEYQALIRNVPSSFNRSPVVVNKVDRSVRSTVSNFVTGRPKASPYTPMGAAGGGSGGGGY